MSDNRKKGSPEEDFSFDGNFDFEGDDGAPAPQGGGSDFDIEDLPDPTQYRSAPEPEAAGRRTAASDFEDEFPDDEPEEQPVRGPLTPARRPMQTDPEDFGFDNGDHDDSEETPRARPGSRQAYASGDDGQDGFEDITDDQGGDPHEDAGTEEDEEEQEAAPASSNIHQKVKYAVFAGGALLLAVTGYFGATTILPAFLGTGEEPIQVAVPASVPLGPKQTTNLPGPGAAPVLPASQAQPIGPKTGPSLPPLGPKAAPAAQQASAGDAISLTPAPAAAPVQVPSMGLGASQPQPSALDPQLVERLKLVERQFEQLKSQSEGRIRDLEAKLAALEAKPAAAPAQAAIPAPMVVPPSKPVFVDNWSLKGVTKDVAWVDGPGGFREIRAGAELPGVGTVRGIKKYEGTWVVDTTAGLIGQ